MSWLNDVPNPGDAGLLSRHRHGDGRIADPRILKDKIDQPSFIDLDHLVFITERLPKRICFTGNSAISSFIFFGVIQTCIKGGKAARLLHRRDPEFTESGVFLDQELFTLRPQRLCGEYLSSDQYINIASVYFAPATNTISKHPSPRPRDVHDFREVLDIGLQLGPSLGVTTKSGCS